MKKETLPTVTPGEILLEEFLKPLAISQNRLGRDLGVPAQRIGQIVNGRRAITLDTALRLAAYFKTSPDFWMNLQTQYELRKARAERTAERIMKEVRPLKAANG